MFCMTASLLLGQELEVETILLGLNEPLEKEDVVNIVLHPPFSIILAPFIRTWYLERSLCVSEGGITVVEGYQTPNT